MKESEEQIFHQYLDDMKGRLTANHVDCVRMVWSLICGHFGKFSLPVTLLTVDGALQLAWTHNRRHVSIDIYESRWDWFYRDRTTGECDSDDVVCFSTLPEALTRYLSMLNAVTAG